LALKKKKKLLRLGRKSMATSVKRKVQVMDAEYVKDVDSIVIFGECSDGRLRHQIHSSCFNFGDRDKTEEMKKTAKMMIGKNITMVFDPDLLEKIKDHAKLKY
jgi:hypothetical protein